MTSEDLSMGQLPDDDTLRRAGASLPASIEPGRDLWPGIVAGIRESQTTAIAPPRGAMERWTPVLAAAASLSAVALVLLIGLNAGVQPEAPVALSTPVAASYMGPAFMQTRDRLRSTLDEQLTELSPQARQVVESNLGQIERSLAAINEALAVEPGNTSLHHLLMETSRQQLELLQKFNQITGDLPEGVDI